MELELLGLSNEHQLDDELPDYVRSQAGMDAKKQVDARTRAKDLEAWWRSSKAIGN
jgi:hypothetical protein